MEMCVPFTTFERSHHFQAIHGHIFKFWRIKSQSLSGERTGVKWNTFFTRWKFPPKFPEIFCKWKTPFVPLLDQQVGLRREKPDPLVKGNEDSGNEIARERGKFPATPSFPGRFVPASELVSRTGLRVCEGSTVFQRESSGGSSIRLDNRNDSIK